MPKDVVARRAFEALLVFNDHVLQSGSRFLRDIYFVNIDMESTQATNDVFQCLVKATDIMSSKTSVFPGYSTLLTNPRQVKRTSSRDDSTPPRAGTDERGPDRSPAAPSPVSTGAAAQVHGAGSPNNVESQRHTQAHVLPSDARFSQPSSGRQTSATSADAVGRLDSDRPEEQRHNRKDASQREPVDSSRDVDRNLSTQQNAGSLASVSSLNGGISIDDSTSAKTGTADANLIPGQFDRHRQTGSRDTASASERQCDGRWYLQLKCLQFVADVVFGIGS